MAGSAVVMRRAVKELAIDSQGFVYIAGYFNFETAWGTNQVLPRRHPVTC